MFYNCNGAFSLLYLPMKGQKSAYFEGTFEFDRRESLEGDILFYPQKIRVTPSVETGQIEL